MCVSFVNDTESVMATRIEKLSGDVTMLTLSPGERAGVRASVNSYSTENSEEPRFTRLRVESSAFARHNRVAPALRGIRERRLAGA